MILTIPMTVWRVKARVSTDVRYLALLHCGLFMDSILNTKEIIWRLKYLSIKIIFNKREEKMPVKTAQFEINGVTYEVDWSDFGKTSVLLNNKLYYVGLWNNRHLKPDALSLVPDDISKMSEGEIARTFHAAIARVIDTDLLKKESVLTEDTVKQIFLDCTPEPLTGLLTLSHVEGLETAIDLKANSLIIHEKLIVDMLRELPVAFRTVNGGASVSKAFFKNSGRRWTDSPDMVGNLVFLGRGIDRVIYPYKRDEWHFLAGGLPVIVLRVD